MADPFFSRLFWSLCLLLTLATLLPGCGRSWTSHDLEQTAIESLPVDHRAAPIEVAAGLAPDDHTPQGLARAAAILEHANQDAAASSESRAVQAVVIARLFACCYDRQDLPWLTPEGAPELWSQLNDTFNQADARLHAEPTDLVNAMVWSRSGTALKRDAELRAALQLAASDKQLRATLCEDDPSRALLYNYAHGSPARKEWHTDAAFLYRAPSEGSVGERLLVAVVYVPFMAVVLVIYVLSGHSPL
ncbi:MAG: hypothetical protein QM783_04135 [Phycisphaerales bacterium]